MTYSKLFGVYFSETVGNTGTTTVERIYHPCFIVQTSTAIAELDDELIRFESIEAFKTLTTGKGLTKTTLFIEQILNDYQSEIFYVYSIKTDTAAAFTAFIQNSAYKEDIKEFVYIEETKSANANTLNSKINAIATALEDDNFEKGIFRTLDVIPYGTVSDAVTNKAEGARDETAAITAMTRALTGVISGRVSLIVPYADYAGYVAGRIVSTPFYREPGNTVLNIEGSLDFNFNDSEMLTLQNAGICFIKEELLEGVLQYRIHAGLNCSFAANGADGFIKGRKTVDETLRQVKEACILYYKNEDVDVSKAEIQTVCNNVVSDFINEGYLLKSIVKDGVTYTSALTASIDANNRIGLQITGTLIPSGSAMVINVNTTIQ